MVYKLRILCDCSKLPIKVLLHHHKKTLINIELMKKFLLSILCLMLITSTINFTQAQDYVGSQSCETCHSEKYLDWEASGHPYKFSIIENNNPPTYPDHAVNFQGTWMDSLGDGTHSWADVAGVIGGFGWKARFVGTDGIIIGTAGSSFNDAGMGHNQFNFFGGEEHGWVNYETAHESKKYNYSCFKCHTTGGDTVGTWLPGVEGLGTFTEGGIGCEACHGPGSAHIASPTADNIDRVYEQVHLDNSVGGLSIGGEVQTSSTTSDDVTFMCGTCHNRSYTEPINSSGGFIKHHEQWDEFAATKHGSGNMSCTTCHDPHKGVLWGGEGIKMDCKTCHSTQESHTNHSAGAGCVDCHMPFAAKSGTKRGASGYQGDVRSHLWAITVDAETMFTDDSSAVKDDDERSASLSIHFACLGCHNADPDDDIPNKTLADAVVSAAEMHNATSISNIGERITVGLYPNPAVDQVQISYYLNNSENVSIKIFNATGQEVYSINNKFENAGTHVINWNGTNSFGEEVKAGVYFVNINTENSSQTSKLVLMK
jgi:Secretion system C-terminal sorting domain/Cytochrome c554 and c-prime